MPEFISKAHPGDPTNSRVIGDGPQRATVRFRSASLSEKQVGDVLAGAANAISLDLPLNRSIVMNWEQAGVVDAVGATGRFLKLARDALHKRSADTAYIWVQERGITVGQHAHILMHVPPRLIPWFSRMQWRWLKQCGARRVKRMVHTRPVGDGYSAALGNAVDRMIYRQNLWRVVHYLLKDASEKARKKHSVRPIGTFGAVRGKRSAVSQNLRSLASN